MYIPEAALPTTVRATLNARLRRERMLESPGHVLVGMNQQVEPATVVVEGERPGGVRIIDIAAELGLAGRKVASALLVQRGDEIQAQQPIAAVKRLLRRRELLAPVSGTILDVDSRGQMLIGTGAEQVQLVAGLRGNIVHIVPNFGVVVEGNGALIQGVWGNGVESRASILRVLVSHPAEELAPERIEMSVRGTIVVVGALLSEQALQNAINVQVGGIVVGGMPADLRPRAKEVPFPIMLVEGFGACPIAGDLFELMQDANEREVVLNGRYQMRFGRVLPELIIPRTHAAEPLPDLDILQDGQLVRLVTPPYYGAVGLVKSIDAGRQRMESGIAMPGCEVDLVSGGTVFVPYTNLERIG